VENELRAGRGDPEANICNENSSQRHKEHKEELVIRRKKALLKFLPAFLFRIFFVSCFVFLLCALRAF